ncbi:Na/Pi cotransporter family protein, partial [Pseudomonas aeruginosa]
QAGRIIDQLSAAIRAYLADLGQDGLGDSDADRAQEILLFAINIEHIGDLVANSLLPLAMRWAGRSRAGSEFELGRMLPLQAAIEESLHLAISAFLREDLDAALRLVARKKLLQRLEADASRERFRRLRDDRGAWVESGDVFQRILRDYR